MDIQEPSLPVWCVSRGCIHSMREWDDGYNVMGIWILYLLERYTEHMYNGINDSFVFN